MILDIFWFCLQANWMGSLTKIILRTLGTKRIYGCLANFWGNVPCFIQNLPIFLNFHYFYSFKMSKRIWKVKIFNIYMCISSAKLTFKTFQKVFDSQHGHKLVKTPQFLHFSDKQCPFNQNFVKQLHIFCSQSSKNYFLPLKTPLPSSETQKWA